MPPNWAFSSDYYSRSINVLETALAKVPAYYSWRSLDPGSKYSVDERYAAMPALSKKDIREHFPQGLLPIDSDLKHGLTNREIEFVETSGMVHDSVTNIWNQQWWDASEKASWKLNSYANKVATGNHPEAILANPLNVGFVSDTVDLPMEKRRLSRFLYLNEKTNPVSWTQKHMDRMIKELGLFQPVILEANPSLLSRLCRYIIFHNKSVFQPQLIVLTYEYPSELHYRQIRKVFNVPIASSYGTTETGYVFMQCEEGKFHQNSESCRVDFQPFKLEHGGPLLGRILVTTFNNPWYYILRFDVGDIVHIDKERKCACGRDSGLILSSVEGRITNVTLTCTGRLVSLYELDRAMSVLEGIDEYRLEQVTRNEYSLYLVSQRLDKGMIGEQASAVLKNLYGQEAKVTIIFQDAVSPEKSGKYNLAKTLFPVEIENYLDEIYVNK